MKFYLSSCLIVQNTWKTISSFIAWIFLLMNSPMTKLKRQSHDSNSLSWKTNSQNRNTWYDIFCHPVAAFCLLLILKIPLGWSIDSLLLTACCIRFERTHPPPSTSCNGQCLWLCWFFSLISRASSSSNYTTENFCVYLVFLYPFE